MLDLPANGDRTALIAGATGLVGGHCLAALEASREYGRIIALTRHEARLETRSSRVAWRHIDFARWPEPPACDVAFSALGTTIRAAGSQEAFRRVDLDHVCDFAAWARTGGARTLVLVSAVGADPESRSFYLRTKGEAERAVLALGFRGVHVFRPSLLLGRRREFRLGERLAAPLMRAASFLMIDALLKYRPIRASEVGEAMVHASLTRLDGARIYHHADIRRLARGGW